PRRSRSLPYRDWDRAYQIENRQGFGDPCDYGSSSNGEQFVKKVNKDKTEEQVLEQVKTKVNRNKMKDRNVNEGKRRTANKFAILQDIEEEDGFAKLSMKEKEEVDM
ncbi:hypothetical protein Tco_1372062, partial [Tanacetum coccineum]